MESTQIAQLAGLTVVLLVGLASIVSLSYRSYVADHWEQSRCNPGVIPIASLFKPSEDPRTPAEFAADNWRFCQREYVQDAIRVAAKAPAELAEATADTVADVKALAGVTGDIFTDLWHFCHDVYKKFMGQMATTATLFRNFMIRLYSLVDRLQGSALSIVYSLIAVIVGIINSIHVTVMAAVIVVGIMIALQIILFFLIWPISGLLATVAAMVDVVVISMATAVAGASGELFSGGSASACFTGDSPIRMADGSFKPISEIGLGDLLYGSKGSNRVTAVHRSVTREAVYQIGDVKVTGDHLIYLLTSGNPCYVKDLPLAPQEGGIEKEVRCLTTTERKIPTATATFADWEEIPDEDMDTKKAWYYDVYSHLNHKSKRAPTEPTEAILNSDAGFSKDTKVWMEDGRWCPISEVKIGDTIVSDWVVWNPDIKVRELTKVTGIVEIEGDMETDAISIGSAVMTPSIWINEGRSPLQGIPLPPPPLTINDFGFVAGAFHPCAKTIEMHPDRWFHLYTETGKFLIQNENPLVVRDANEVDGERMEEMVRYHVIEGTKERSEIYFPDNK